MRTVFADTGYWIALINPADSLHRRARLITKNLQPLQIVTSEMVLTEFLNTFSKHGNFIRNTAVSLIEQSITRSDIEIIPQTSELFRSALALYRQRPDQDWSHTDCASFQIMQEQNITEALAHDKHFEQAGFIALLRSN